MVEFQMQINTQLKSDSTSKFPYEFHTCATSTLPSRLLQHFTHLLIVCSSQFILCMCFNAILILLHLFPTALSEDAVFAFQISCNLLSFTLKIPEEINRRSMLFHNLKAVTISNVTMYIQTFTTVVDWPEIWRLLEVSTMFYCHQMAKCEALTDSKIFYYQYSCLLPRFGRLENCLLCLHI